MNQRHFGGKTYKPSSFGYEFWQEYHSGGNKFSNVRSFIILGSVEGLSSFNEYNSANVSGGKKYNAAFRGIYCLRIREKRLKLTLLSSFANLERSLLLHPCKTSYKAVPGATKPASTPILQFVLESAKKYFQGWCNHSGGIRKAGEGDARGSPDALNASIMQTRDVLSNWANKCHVNKIVYCIAGWHVRIYENKVC